MDLGRMTRDRQTLFYDCLNTEYKRMGLRWLFNQEMALKRKRLVE